MLYGVTAVRGARRARQRSMTRRRPSFGLRLLAGELSHFVRNVGGTTRRVMTRP